MLDPKLLEILVCPVTKAQLVYKPDCAESCGRAGGLAHPIRADTRVILQEEARQLPSEERSSLSA